MNDLVRQLDDLVEKLAETPRIKNITGRMNPSHWFLLGAFAAVFINLTLNFSLILVETFTWLCYAVLEWLCTGLLGAERARELTDILTGNGNDPSDPYVITDLFVYDLFVYATDIAMAIAKGLVAFGHAIYEFFEISFPVLTDIDLDIDWLHISLSQIARTFFSFLQFIIMFYILRRVRRAIKNKIKKRIALLDNDYFDKQFFKGVINV